jgi:hypothetical protein
MDILRPTEKLLRGDDVAASEVTPPIIELRSDLVPRDAMAGDAEPEVGSLHGTVRSVLDHTRRLGSVVEMGEALVNMLYSYRGLQQAIPQVSVWGGCGWAADARQGEPVALCPFPRDPRTLGTS